MSFNKTVSQYYGDLQIQRYYQKFWSEKLIHIGFFDSTNENLEEASLNATHSLEQKISTHGNNKSNLLDLGTGFGGDATFLSSLGYSVTGLDGCEENLEVCRKDDEEGKVNWVHGYFEELPFQNDLFNIVWAHETMVHVEDKALVFNEVKRVLKKDGIFMFTDILVSNSIKDDDREQVESRIPIKAFSPNQYNDLISELGFELLEHTMATENIKLHYKKLQEEVMKFEQFDEILTKDWKEKALSGLKQWNEFLKKEWIVYGYWIIRRIS